MRVGDVRGAGTLCSASRASASLECVLWRVDIDVAPAAVPTRRDNRRDDAHGDKRGLQAAVAAAHRPAPLPAPERAACARGRHHAGPTHQLLLAVRGHPDPRGPTVGDVAGYLLLRHHSAVGLVDRAEKAGLLIRGHDAENVSVVRLHLTDRGSRQLDALSEQRHRLDRGGNRQLNTAIHRIALTRARCHPETRAYLARKRADGKTGLDAMRCLKRHLTRRIWHLLQAPALDRNDHHLLT
jgi:transposase